MIFALGLAVFATLAGLSAAIAGTGHGAYRTLPTRTFDR